MPSSTVPAKRTAPRFKIFTPRMPSARSSPMSAYSVPSAQVATRVCPCVIRCGSTVRSVTLARMVPKRGMAFAPSSQRPSRPPPRRRSTQRGCSVNLLRAAAVFSPVFRSLGWGATCACGRRLPSSPRRRGSPGAAGWTKPGKAVRGLQPGGGG